MYQVQVVILGLYQAVGQVAQQVLALLAQLVQQVVIYLWQQIIAAVQEQLEY